MSDQTTTTRLPLRVLYCRCAYAKVVPEEVKDAVLQKLCESGQPFDMVADLCEMSARRDPSLKKIAEAAGACGGIKIAACYPRAVKWLFNGADAPLPAEGVEVLNMRDQTADTIVGSLLAEVKL